MTPTVVAEGLEFPEGPVWLGPKRVSVTEIRGQCISLWENGQLRRKVAVTGGGANGATIGADGALYVTNNGGVSLGHEGHWIAPDGFNGRIQRVTLDGKVTDVPAKLPGAQPNRPNDCCFGPDGLLYYTDPHNWEELPEVKPGRVARTTLDGKVELLATVPLFPNGIAFGVDDRLYVAQSMTQKILVMDSVPEPTIKEFATLPEGYPDGPKNFFRNFYQWVAEGKVPAKGQADFATFEDGHCEILICEAILKSAKQKKWVKV